MVNSSFFLFKAAINVQTVVLNGQVGVVGAVVLFMIAKKQNSKYI